MTTIYFVALLIGAVICTGLFSWKLRRAELKAAAAVIAMPLACLLGLVMAKLMYFVLELRDQLILYEGLSGLFTAVPCEFCFVGGCLGVILAVVLAARLSGQRILPVLDAFAPCGALMAAITRASEGLLDMTWLVGAGDFVENEALQFFPFAVEDASMGIWFYAVFMLEAALALVCALVAFAVSHKGGFATGRVFLHTTFFLALPQIFSEQMLGQFMAWGFVRIEQLLCALIVFGILLYACILRRKAVAFIPAAGCLVCAAVVIWMEFTLDNKLLFDIELPPLGCYLVMIAALCGMAGLSLYSYHKLNQAE